MTALIGAPQNCFRSLLRPDPGGRRAHMGPTRVRGVYTLGQMSQNWSSDYVIVVLDNNAELRETP